MTEYVRLERGREVIVMRMWAPWLVSLTLLGCDAVEDNDGDRGVGFDDTGIPVVDTAPDGNNPVTTAPPPTGGGGYADCLLGTETVCFCQSCLTPDRQGTFDRYLTSCVDGGEYREFVLCYLDQTDPLGNGQYEIDCPSAWYSCRDLLP